MRPPRPVAVPAIRGVVARGDRRGTELGFPTANLALGDGDEPGDGVYSGTVQLAGGGTWAAAVSIGRRSTFYGRDGVRLLEAHLLDFDGSLYGQVITVELHHLLRLQRRFDGAGALVEQLRRDVEEVRRLVRPAGRRSAG